MRAARVGVVVRGGVVWERALRASWTPNMVPPVHELRFNCLLAWLIRMVVERSAKRVLFRWGALAWFLRGDRVARRRYGCLVRVGCRGRVD